MSLLEDITEKRKDIHADSYDMSVGEVINMYKDGDLDIHPEFQRFFRWSDSQKTSLIESLLLNIPINIGAFEIIAIGLGWLDGNVPDNFDLQEKVKALWVNIKQEDLSWSGNSASGRLGKTLELAKSFYEN